MAPKPTLAPSPLLDRLQRQRSIERDSVTGLLGRAAAEEALIHANRSGVAAYALTVVVERFQMFNMRFGYEAGDQILRFVADMLAHRLPAADALYRWTGPALVALLYRPRQTELVQEELSRLIDYKYDHVVTTAARTALVSIFLRWSVFPVGESPAQWIQEIDRFAVWHGA